VGTLSLTLLGGWAEELADIVLEGVVDACRVTFALSETSIQAGSCRSGDRSWVTSWLSV